MLCFNCICKKNQSLWITCYFCPILQKKYFTVNKGIRWVHTRSGGTAELQPSSSHSEHISSSQCFCFAVPSHSELFFSSRSISRCPFSLVSLYLFVCFRHSTTCGTLFGIVILFGELFAFSPVSVRDFLSTSRLADCGWLSDTFD